MRILSSNLISPYNSRGSSKMQTSKQVTRIANSLDSFNSSPKTKARENSRMMVKVIMFLLGQSVAGVKNLDT